MFKSLWNSGSELFADGAEEFLNGFLVAFEEVPLADFPAADQTGTLQGRQMRGHRRLRQAAALIDLSGTNAVLVAVTLVGKLDRRVFEPVKDFSPYWVRQGFYYFVEVDGHGSARGE
jgi:hypothetical protein